MAESEKATSTAPSSEPVKSPPRPAVEDDSDPDFDDLDDVLDQFSANAAPKSQAAPAEPIPASIPTTSSPGRTVEPPIPSGPQPDESEDEFMTRLTNEMSTMLSSLASDPAAESQSPEDMLKMGKELEEFTTKMEKEGIKPEDLLKAILGEEEGSKIAEKAQEERKEKSIEPAASSDKGSGATTFEDTIRRTMSRLETSNTEATNATAKSSSKSEEDMLAEMLKAMESGGAGGDEEGGLSQMFLEMMQQLTHKEMLYEPMRELHVQYPTWLGAHKTKLPAAEYERYQRQSTIVADIVTKFEQPGFSDDDPQCREYIWEKMQLMQGEGAPPEELVKNPFPGTELGAIPGMGGGEGPEESCPTQ